MPRSQPKTLAGSSNPAISTTRQAAFETHDQVGYIQDAHRAYEALEQLITPSGAHDREHLDLERSDLGALLRLLNRGMREQIDAAKACAQAAWHASQEAA